MRTAPVKPEFGPTLPELLAGPWQRASRTTRGSVLAGLALVLALVALIVFVTWPTSISRGGRVPFSFEYADHLRQVAAPRGQLAKVEARSRGLLAASLAVAAVRLPPYSGDLESELPLYANALLPRLVATYPGFALALEGKVRDNDVPGYAIGFSATPHGRPVLGRVVLLFPDRPQQRDGLALTMLERPNTQVTSPDKVGMAGDLKLPFTTFAIG
jgi:hypothetical protein